MYATQADIEKRIDAKTLRQITNDDPAAASPDSEVIGEMLKIGNAIVDDALRGRYTLPLADNYEVLTDIASTIAILKLYERRARTKMPESMTEAVRQAMALLSEYSTGKKVLNVPETSAKPPCIIFKTRQQVFTQDILNRY